MTGEVQLSAPERKPRQRCVFPGVFRVKDKSYKSEWDRASLRLRRIFLRGLLFFTDGGVQIV